MSLEFNNTEIAFSNVLGRSRPKAGPAARTRAATPSSKFEGATALAAGQSAHIASLFVNHDAMASLIPHASRSEQIGSVSAILNSKDMP